MSIADKLAAAIEASESPAADSAPGAPAGAPPSGNASSSESAAGATGEDSASSPTSPASTPAAPTMADLFAEKLAKVREERQAKRLGATAKADREQAARIAADAKADREAAAAERARWEGLKDGSFLDGIKALGKDPAVAFAEMQREAIEAGTPEAQMKRMRAEFDRQLAEQVAPLKKTIDDLTEREKRAKVQASEQSFRGDFAQHVSAPEYEDLVIEYPGDKLLAHVTRLRDTPELLYSEADRLNVRLTDPSRGYTMKDILDVLRAVQVEHETGKQTRRAARTATSPSGAAQQAATSSPTVNGTAAPRNAGASTIGNELAAERASDGKFLPRGGTASQRIRERARRLSGNG
jgi:hypothetical protein